MHALVERATTATCTTRAFVATVKIDDEMTSAESFTFVTSCNLLPHVALHVPSPHMAQLVRRAHMWLHICTRTYDNTYVSTCEYCALVDSHVTIILIYSHVGQHVGLHMWLHM